MIKLIALDLDGTVVNHDLSIAPETIQILQHLIHQTEVKVVVATGRMHPSAMPFVRQIGTPLPVVTYQGAMIREQDHEDHGKHSFIYHQPLPMALAKEVMALLEAEKFRLNLYIDDVMYTNHELTAATRYAKMAGITPVISPNLMQYLTAPPTKLMAIDDDRIDYLLGALRSNFGDQITTCRSRYNFCEMIHRDASKWNAVKLLAERWGIGAHEVMACGDQENDLSMLTHAGLGVAMGNAPDWIKERANAVTDTVENLGVRKAIEQYVLGDMPFDTRPHEDPQPVG